MWLSFYWLSQPLVSAIIGGTLVAISNHILQRNREHVKTKQEKAERIVVLTSKLLSLSNSIARKCSKLEENLGGIAVDYGRSRNDHDDFSEINLIRYEIHS